MTLAQEATKLCPHCERERPLSHFYKSAQTLDGLTSWCQGCVRDRNKKDYANRCDQTKPLEGKKQCCTCKEFKERSAFGRRREAWDGLRFYCKTCNVLRDRKNNLKQSFGLTLEQYHEMSVRQNGVCAICQQPQKGKSLAVDHCHATGKVRDLLCDQCNRSLGGFGDNIDRLKAAISYLEKHNVTHKGD